MLLAPPGDRGGGAERSNTIQVVTGQTGAGEKRRRSWVAGGTSGGTETREGPDICFTI